METRLYKTGDLARYLADGTIAFVGRRDFQVKIRGFRIELGEIEAVLLRHAAVREAVVVTRPDASGDTRLVAYVVPTTDDRQPTTDNRQPMPALSGDEGTDPSDKVTGSSELSHPLTRSPAHPLTAVVGELRTFLMERLPAYMAPSAFVVLDELPRTPNGKLDRRGLPAPEDMPSSLERTYIAPRTLVQEVLAGMWGDALDIERVSIQDNFFDLGGHSLNATKIVSRIRQAFQIDLMVRHLFAAPTVAALAEHMIATEQQPGRTDKIARALQRLKTMSAADRHKILQRKK